MNRSYFGTVVAVLLIITGLWHLAAEPAFSQLNGRSVTVTGNATVHALPDQVTVRFGIVSIDLDPDAARVENGNIAALTMNAVRELGIAERKIQVNVLRIQPYSEYDPATRSNVDRGFQAVRDVTVELDDLEVLPALISGIVDHGANRVHGIAYGLQDAEEFEHDALRKALEDAKTKAQIMAETLGARLGVVLQISEQGIMRPQPQYYQLDTVAARGVGMKETVDNPDAYASGELDVTANVTVVFALIPSGSRRGN